MLLTDYLEKNLEKFPDKTAFVMKMGYRTVSLTYKDVYTLSVKIACFLDEHGVGKGDKVLLLAPNSPYWICVFWGCIQRGAIIVPLNIQSTSEMVKKIAEQTGAKLFFKHLHWKQEAPPHIPVYDIELIEDDVRSVDTAGFRKAELEEDDIAQILYTSGTTGDPKGVVLTHKNLTSNAEAVSRIIPILPHHRFLSILPLSHIFEQIAGFLIPFKNSAMVVHAHSPAVIKELLREYRITHMAAVPEFLKVVMGKIEAKAEEEGRGKLLDRLRSLSNSIGIKPIQRLLFRPILKKFGGKLFMVASGGAPLDPELERKWNALGITLLQGYGITETSPVLAMNTFEARRVGSVGKVLEGVELMITPDHEVLAKGPGVFGGYYKNEEKTREAFTPDGWFRTGDIGEFDKDKFLFLKGRKKYMIKGPGAQNVYPEDIELELNKITGVKDSCVVGLDLPSGQVEIHAVLLFQPDAGSIDPARVVDAVNARLASYQHVTGWSVWPEEDFPRSATRKVKKESVLAWLKSQGEKPTVAKAPTGEVKTPLIQLLALVTDVSIGEIHSGTRIVPELKLDSLLRIELVSRIEEKFGVIVEEPRIARETTVAELEDIIRQTKAPLERPTIKDWPVSWWAPLARTFLWNLFIFPFVRLFVNLKVEGREHLVGLPLPAVFMPNHLSLLDSVVVDMALPPRIRRKVAFATAQDTLYNQYNKFTVMLVELFFNSFPFPRKEEENIKFGLEYMGKRLDQGWSVMVYPEGKMSTTGALQPLKRGAGLVATEMGVLVVPVKIKGIRELVPYDKIIPHRRGIVTVTFGKPLRFSKRDSYIEATKEIEKALVSL